MANIIKNKSKAYGYNYSSLSDLAKAEIEIPVMRTKVTEFGEYVEWFDGKEWQQGAKVVLISGKKMNEAQAYGAALTYARRYTVQLAKAVACDDDKAIETQAPQVQAKPIKARLNFEEIEEKLKAFTDVDELRKYYATIANGATEKQKSYLAGRAKYYADKLKDVAQDEPSEEELEEAGL